MKNLIIVFLCLVYVDCFAQNIRSEIINYGKEFDNKEYSTYEYINSSYSYSRPLLVIITNKEIFKKIHAKIPSLFVIKQEYTDVNLLGIKEFDKNHILDSEKKIINFFIKDIMKYRADNYLPLVTEEQILTNLKYLEKEKDVYKYLKCKKKT